MKRKISLLLSVLVFVLIFATACQGKNQEELVYDEEQLQSVIENMIGNFSQMDEATFDNMEAANDYVLDKALNEIGWPIQREDFIAVMRAWRAGVKECGAYIDHGDLTFETSNRDIKVTTTAQYENSEAELEFVFNDKLELENLTVSAKTTTVQILQKAGKNTLIGMGTVFAVLIFISFIISLLKYIPALLNRKKAQETPVVPVVETHEQKESDTDDFELTAVIAAAIAEAENMPADGFIVRSIKRRKTNRWS